ncbi:MAG: ATP-binding protein [Candidatus Saccharibacteria bacterium]|nr:ATP-binding protein [Candidatus Saccharibacteria bacterium]
MSHHRVKCPVKDYEENMSSRIRIGGFFNSISLKTKTIYDALAEALINAIEAIEESKISNGKISIELERQGTKPELDFGKILTPTIKSVTITDNGIGFDKDNLESFETVYSNHKKGGRGFGRFYFPVFFQDISVKSIYQQDGKFKECKFQFGRDYEIVDQLSESVITPSNKQNCTKLTLANPKLSGKEEFNPSLKYFAHRILEKMPHFFISDNNCPEVTLKEEGEKHLTLNKLIGKKSDLDIQIESEDSFRIRKAQFHYIFFKIFECRNQASYIHLVAHRRVFRTKALHEYIPEYRSDFTENDRKYVVHIYITGKYLDDNVDPSRNKLFHSPNQIKLQDSTISISESEIEEKVAAIVKDSQASWSSEVRLRQTEKFKKFKKYAAENFPDVNPDEINIERLNLNLSEEDMYHVIVANHLSKHQKFRRDFQIFQNNNKDARIAEAKRLTEDLQPLQRFNLTQYMQYRRLTLQTMERLSENNDSKEKDLHDIIFPKGNDSKTKGFFDHSLWILDDTLIHEKYIGDSYHIISDKAVIQSQQERPDLAILAYGNNSTDNSSSLNIFEFKTADDQAKKPSDKDEYQQLLTYLELIFEKKARTFRGKTFNIKEGHTPIFGYIIGGYPNYLERMLARYGFNKIPNRQEWIKYHSDYACFFRYITWEQVIKNAKDRHDTFFRLLNANGMIDWK